MNHWGRIFFFYDENKILSKIKAQPLENHVGNCSHLLQYFSKEYFHPETKEKLERAVLLHDEGKKETFRIHTEEENVSNSKEKVSKTKKETKSKEFSKAGTNEEEKKWIYSFAGHRFHVPPGDPYIASLIRSHHEFSVEQINREKANFQALERQTFSDDLYLLCTVDQIEAELAVKTIEKKEDTSRTFMEFTTHKSQECDLVYHIEPWPFSVDSLEIIFDLRCFPLSQYKISKDTKSIEKMLKESKEAEQESISITIRKDKK